MEVRRHTHSVAMRHDIALLRHVRLLACSLESYQHSIAHYLYTFVSHLGLYWPGHDPQNIAVLLKTGISQNTNKLLSPFVLAEILPEEFLGCHQGPQFACQVLQYLLHLSTAQNCPLWGLWNLCWEVWSSLSVDWHLCGQEKLQVLSVLPRNFINLDNEVVHWGCGSCSA